MGDHLTVEVRDLDRLQHAAFKVQKAIRPRRGGETVHVGHGPQAGGSATDVKPRFAIYRDLAGREILAVVVRPVAGQSSGGRLSVLGAGGEELGELGTLAYAQAVVHRSWGAS